MNKNKIQAIAFAISLLLVVAGSAFGAIDYERVPSGFEIENPVSVLISGLPSETYPTAQSHVITFVHENSETYDSDCFTSGGTNDMDIPAEGDLPDGNYTQVSLESFSDVGCSTSLGTENLEYDGGDTIFAVGEYEPPPSPTFFDNVDDMMTGSVAMIGELFTDISGPLVAGLGLSLALTYVIPKILETLRIRKRGGL